MYGFVNFVKKTLSKKYNYQSHMDRCRVYQDHLKTNSIDEEFKQQLKHDILNEVRTIIDGATREVLEHLSSVKMCLDALKMMLLMRNQTITLEKLIVLI